MKRTRFIPLFAIVSVGLLSVGGCIPEENSHHRNSGGYTGPAYTICVCDADCPAGQTCDQWTGECQIGGSASAGRGGNGGAYGTAGRGGHGGASATGGHAGGPGSTAGRGGIGGSVGIGGSLGGGGSVG